MRPVQSATSIAKRHTRLTHIYPSQERARITPTATPPPRPRRYAASHFDILDTAPTRPLDSTTPRREMTVPDAPHRRALTDDPVPASITGYEQSAGAVAIAADPRADAAARRYAPGPPSIHLSRHQKRTASPHRTTDAPSPRRLQRGRPADESCQASQPAQAIQPAGTTPSIPPGPSILHPVPPSETQLDATHLNPSHARRTGTSGAPLRTRSHPPSHLSRPP
jgi:hypothetical protein